jgi:hypothetical protein
VAEELDRHQQDRSFLDRQGDRTFQGNVDAVSFTGDGTLLSFTVLSLLERSSDPPDPPEGSTVIWMSDGTGSGDDGDVMAKVSAGGTTGTATLIDKSTL